MSERVSASPIPLPETKRRPSETVAFLFAMARAPSMERREPRKWSYFANGAIFFIVAPMTWSML